MHLGKNTYSIETVKINWLNIHMNFYLGETKEIKSFLSLKTKYHIFWNLIYLYNCFNKSYYLRLNRIQNWGKMQYKLI